MTIQESPKIHDGESCLRFPGCNPAFERKKEKLQVANSILTEKEEGMIAGSFDSAKPSNKRAS